MTFSTNYSIINQSSVFLETGTFHGAGIKRALSEGFKKVISIEVYEPLWLENLDRFKNEIEDGKVSLIFGDSGYVIGDAVAEIDDPIVFWFDAHDQTMSNAGVGDVKCPIIKELANIMECRNISQRRLDTLMIDDMRLITRPNHWSVDIGQMYELIWHFNPDFALTRIEGFINHDILKCEYRFLQK